MAVRDVVQAAAGQGGDKLYVEDVFSTYLYDANLSSGVVVNNGINLLDEGGLIWTKCRNFATDHGLYDSERTSFQKLLRSNTTIQELNSGTHIQATTTGYTIDSTGYPETNNNNTGAKHASWTFRKAPKFFDVVTYTGNAGVPTTIPHNLGSDVGCLIIKSTTNTGNWFVWHRSFANNDRLYLNTTAAKTTDVTTYADSNFIYLNGPDSFTNGSVSTTYVAYLFAHDAGGFGDDGLQNVISCGSYTGVAGTQTVNVGFEPQWLLIKKTNSTANWKIVDNMRGFYSGPEGGSPYSNTLIPNTSEAEAANSTLFTTSTGFTVNNYSSEGGAGNTFIYIAIRRGPMKTPELGTEVFEPVFGVASGTPVFPSSFTVDATILHNPPSVSVHNIGSRLTGDVQMYTDSTGAESTQTGWGWDQQTGIWDGANLTTYVAHMFRRAPSFMDVVAYTGNGVADRQIPHNLGVTPQLAFTKQRSGDTNTNWWNIYFPTGQVRTFNANAFSNWGMTASETWFEGDISLNNVSGKPYIAYLFASCPGVSKVGSYTGTGTTQTINCGFSSGARFVLIKRTDSTGDWYVWDSARGIVAGNDPYLLLNSTAAEVTTTDYIDPVASGFEISSSAPAAINASGGSYIFLAIA